MKDSELRAIVLQQFYERRKEGYIGLHAQGPPQINLGPIDEDDMLRICDQLGQYGLIEWNGIDGNEGKIIAGVGRISASGIDVIEGEAEPPLPMHLDQSHHVQNINISGSQGGVQIGGAHSNQSQAITLEIEKLIGAINGANVNEAQKREAKSILAKLLTSEAVQTVLGAGVQALIKMCA